MHIFFRVFIYCAGFLLFLFMLSSLLISYEPSRDFILKRGIKLALGAEDVSFEGSPLRFSEGIRIDRLRVISPRVLPKGYSVHFDAVELQWGRHFSIQTPAYVAHGASISDRYGKELGSIAWLKGQWQGLIIMRQVNVEGVPPLPSGARIRAQRIELRQKGLRVRLTRIHNGRVFLPYSEPVLVEVTDGDSGSIETRVVDLRTIKEFFFPEANLPVRGELHALKVSAHLEDEKITVRGNLLLDPLTLEYAEFGKVPVEITGSLDLSTTPIGLHAELSAEKGSFMAGKVLMRLQAARLSLTGLHAKPRFFLQAQGRVENLNIQLQVSGTFDDPKVSLSSTPPRPQPFLMLVLATGKRWGAVESAATEGRWNPGLEQEFIRYLFLGDRSNVLAQRLGLDDVYFSPIGEAKRVGVRKQIRQVGLSYDYTFSRDEEEQQRNTHTLGVDWAVTESTALELEAERTLSPQGRGDVYGPPPQEPEDAISIRLRRAF